MRILAFAAGLVAATLSAHKLQAQPEPVSSRIAAELDAPDTVILGPELATYGSALYELEEALAAREGITFLSSGDAGSEDWILVRGLPRDSSRNVLVLLDGVPINNGAYEGVEAHDLPASLIERVEVYRAPLPARFGGYHAVLAFYTHAKRTTQGVDFQGAASTGSLATHRAEAGASAHHGRFNLDLSIATFSTDALSRRNRTPPYENLRYEDRSYWDYAPTLRASYRPSERTEITSLVLSSNGRKHFSDDEYRNRWFVLAGMGAVHRASEAVTLRANAHAGYERYFLRLRMHPDVGLQLRRRLGARVEAAFEPAEWTTTLMGAEGSERRLDELGRLATLGAVAVFAEQRISPSRRVSLGVGARLSSFSSDLPAPPRSADAGEPVHDGGGSWTSGVGWSGNAALRPWAGGVLSTRVGLNLRDPALGELPRGAELESERLWGSELRFAQAVASDRLTVSATGYSLRLQDEIGTGADSNYTNLPAETMSRGVETRLEARFPGALTGYVTYTLSEATGPSGKPIAYGPPRHMGSAGLLLNDAGTTGRLSARYLGTKEGILRHMGDEGRVQDALLLDMYVERALHEQVAVFVHGSNLLNVTYETFQGRPMMPRTVLVGVSIAREL